MKTKIEIIQSLLDKRKITAAEAMILMEKEKEYVYYPYNAPYPVYPITYPSWPIYKVGETMSELVVSSN